MNQVSSNSHPQGSPPDSAQPGGRAGAGSERAFRWDALAPRLVHPLKVAIIEALLWIEGPLSPADIERSFSGRYGLSLVSYHVRTLVRAGVLAKVDRRQVRGATQTYYYFASELAGS